MDCKVAHMCTSKPLSEMLESIVLDYYGKVCMKAGLRIGLLRG